MLRQKREPSFADQARAIAAQAAKDDLAERLSDLAKGITARKAPKPRFAVDNTAEAQRVLNAALSRAVSGLVRAQRRAPRRVGSYRAYQPTGKFNDARRGTFRHYMLATILAHAETGAASRAHEASGEHAKNKLDFRWAADNGYIRFV